MKQFIKAFAVPLCFLAAGLCFVGGAYTEHIVMTPMLRQYQISLDTNFVYIMDGDRLVYTGDYKTELGRIIITDNE